MNSMMAGALSCIRRGWYVFPCWPPTPARNKKGKEPLFDGAYMDATLDEAQVRAWWAKTPNANVGLAVGRFRKIVVDVDTGLTCAEDLPAFFAKYNLPETYVVRTGKRPDFRVQLYFDGTGAESFNGWALDEYKGDVRGTWGHVMAAGCLHESGATYVVLWDKPIAPAPPWVYQLKDHQVTKKAQDLDPAAPITEWRNQHMISLLGRHRQAGADDAAIEFYARHINETRMKDNPLDEEELARLIKNACGYPAGALEPIPVLGTPKAPQEPQEPKDWRTNFHSIEEMENAPPAAFLIDGWLMLDAITALAAPVAQRKSLIALNVAHALCTKEPLFDHFAVVQQPTRVLYLCPEMGIRSFTERLRKIGLMPYVGKTLFCRTSSSGGELALDDMTPESLAGAVVIIDTAVRYLKGDENSSEHMREFAKSIFRLMRDGAASVLLLHHSAKGTKDSGELTLENCMRGSGELGAFLSSCWATRFQDPSEPYKSASYITNVKQRDFESKPFEVTSGPDCRLHIVADPETATVTLQPRSAFKGNKDGKDEAALVFVKANVKVSNVRLSAMLKEAEMPRSAEWIRKRKYDLLQANGGMMP